LSFCLSVTVENNAEEKQHNKHLMDLLIGCHLVFDSVQISMLLVIESCGKEMS